MRPLALRSEQFKAVKSILTHCRSNVVHHQFPLAESSNSTSISRRTEHPKGKMSVTKHALQLHRIAFPGERKRGNEAVYKLSLCYFAVSALHVFIWPSVKSVSGIMAAYRLCIWLLWSKTFLRQAPMIFSTATKKCHPAASLQPLHHTWLTWLSELP